MTTSAQIKKLVQPLLERNPELVISGRFVFFRQVNHILRGVYIDRYSYKRGFRPFWTIGLLVQPSPNNIYGYALGQEIYPAPLDHWYINNPNIEEKFADRIEEIVLPRLKSVQTIEDYLNITIKEVYPTVTIEKNPVEKSPVKKIYVDLALGNLEEAENLFEMFSEQPDYWAKSFFKEGHFAELMNIVRPMVQAQDKVGIAVKLHEWEAYSVKQLKLEKYWQASPFPIEM
jgi:hypothetical protein